VCVCVCVCVCRARVERERTHTHVGERECCVEREIESTHKRRRERVP
jgi:hypothetical protein